MHCVCYLRLRACVKESGLHFEHIMKLTTSNLWVWASPGGLARPLESSGLAQSWKRLIRVQFVQFVF